MASGSPGEPTRRPGGTPCLTRSCARRQVRLDRVDRAGDPRYAEAVPHLRGHFTSLVPLFWKRRDLRNWRRRPARSAPSRARPPGLAGLRKSMERHRRARAGRGAARVKGIRPRRVEPAAAGRSGALFCERSCSAHPYGGPSRIASLIPATAPASRPTSNAGPIAPWPPQFTAAQTRVRAVSSHGSRHGAFNGLRLRRGESRRLRSVRRRSRSTIAS